MIVDALVELTGGDAGDDKRRNCVENFGGKPAGGAHASERLGAVQFDDAVAGLDPVVVGNGDIFGHGP